MRELIKHLREEIEHLEAMDAQRFELPPQDITLKQAAARLRALLPDAYLSIKMELSGHGSRVHGPDPWEAEWTIWDGKKNHEGKTLGAAVQACVLAHQPAPQTPLETADDLVSEAQIGF